MSEAFKPEQFCNHELSIPLPAESLDRLTVITLSTVCLGKPKHEGPHTSGPVFVSWGDLGQEVLHE